MAEQIITIIDVGPASMGVMDFICTYELKRRGVRFLPRQAMKRALRSARQNPINPFAVSSGQPEN